MPSFLAEINIVGGTLASSEYFFDIYIRSCTGGTWTQIATNVNYSGFPYSFNLYSYLGDVYCYEYRVVEVNLLSECSGSETYPSPTPTNTLTPTTTPTITPTPTTPYTEILFGVYFESGSTIANYSFTASTPVVESTTIDFTNVLYKNDGSTYEIVSSVTIDAGDTIGTTKVTIPSLNFSDLNYDEISFTGVTGSSETLNFKKYADVQFQGQVGPQFTNYIFKSCCAPFTSISAQVPNTALLPPNGWIYLGWGINDKGTCYIPEGPGGNGQYGAIWGPEIKSCSTIYGCKPCPSPTPTPTITKTSTPTSEPTPRATSTPTNTITPTITTTQTPTITSPPDLIYMSFSSICDNELFHISVLPALSGLVLNLPSVNHIGVVANGFVEGHFEPGQCYQYLGDQQLGTNIGTIDNILEILSFEPGQDYLVPSACTQNNPCSPVSFSVVIELCCPDKYGDTQNTSVTLELMGDIQELQVGNVLSLYGDQYIILVIFNGVYPEFPVVQVQDNQILLDSCDDLISSGVTACYTNLYQGCTTGNYYQLLGNSNYNNFSIVGTIWQNDTAFLGLDLCATAVTLNIISEISPIYSFLLSPLIDVDNCQDPSCALTPTPTPTQTVTPTNTATQTITPTLTPTQTVTPTVTSTSPPPTLSTTPTTSLTPTITTTPTRTPTKTPTQTPSNIVINTGPLFLSGTSSNVAFYLDPTSLVLKNGVTYQGFENLYEVGTILEGNLYLTQYDTLSASLNKRPVLIDNELVPLTDTTYKVITLDDFLSNPYVRYNTCYQDGCQNGLTSYQTPPYNRVTQPPLYRFSGGTTKIIYEFTEVENPNTDPIIPYDGVIKLKVYVKSTLSSSVYLPEIEFLVQSFIETMDNSEYENEIEYDIEVLSPSNPLYAFGGTGLALGVSLGSISNYIYSQGGLKTFTGFDYCIYLRLDQSLGISSSGIAQIGGNICYAHLINNWNSNLSPAGLSDASYVFNHELGHVLGSFHTFACNWSQIFDLDTLNLDNHTQSNQGTCYSCDNDLYITYSAETNNKRAIMSYTLIGGDSCGQPSSHSTALDSSVFYETFTPGPSNVILLPNQWTTLETSFAYNFGDTNINYINYFDSSDIPSLPTTASVKFNYSFLSPPPVAPDPLYANVYIVSGTTKLLEIAEFIITSFQSNTSFTYNFDGSEISQIFGVSDLTKIGIMFEVENFVPGHNLQIIGSTVNFTVDSIIYRAKEEFTVKYTDNTLTTVSYTYNTPSGSVPLIDKFTSYEYSVFETLNKLKKNYFSS